MDSSLQSTLSERNNTMERPLEEELHPELLRLWRMPSCEIFEGVFGSTSGETTQELDPNLWKTLSEDALEKVVTRLPMKDLVRSQLLSRKWRDLYRSQEFQAEVSGVSSSWVSYYPVCVNDNVLVGFDRSSNTWQNLFSIPPLPSLEAQFRRARRMRHRTPVQWTWLRSSVTGSLMIFQSLDKTLSVLNFFICNPINQAARAIVPLDLSNQVFMVAGCVVMDSYRYQILALTCNEQTPNVQVPNVQARNVQALNVQARNVQADHVLEVRVYCSDLQSWKEPVRGPMLRDADDYVDSRSAYLENMFYLSFLKNETRESSDLRDELSSHLVWFLEHQMVFYSYHTQEAEFKQFNVVLRIPPQGPDLPIQHCELLACGKELLLLIYQGAHNQNQKQQEEWQEQESLMSTVSDSQNSNTSRFRSEPWYSQRGLRFGTEPWLYIPKQSFIIFKLDPKSFELIEISRGPLQKLSGMKFGGSVYCDKDYVYVQTKNENQKPSMYDSDSEDLPAEEAMDIKIQDYGVLMFDMRQQMWSTLSPSDLLRHWKTRTPRLKNSKWQQAECFFQPGLNPFIIP